MLVYILKNIHVRIHTSDAASSPFPISIPQHGALEFFLAVQ